MIRVCPKCKKKFKANKDFFVTKHGQLDICKNCSREKFKKYYQKNKSKILDNVAKNYQKNKKAINKRNMELYFKKRDYLLTQKKEYYKKNKTEIKQRLTRGFKNWTDSKLSMLVADIYNDDYRDKYNPWEIYISGVLTNQNYKYREELYNLNKFKKNKPEKKGKRYLMSEKWCSNIYQRINIKFNNSNKKNTWEEKFYSLINTIRTSKRDKYINEIKR